MKCPVCGEKTKRIKRDYRYIESGLDNIILKNIWVYECPCGEVMPELKNIEEMHKAIALTIVKKPSPLNGKEVRFIRKEMGVKAKEFASILGVDPVSVSRWESSEAKVGITSDRLIRMLFIQTMEEQCNIAFKGIFATLKAIKKTESQKPIEVSCGSWEKLCSAVFV